MAATAGRPVGYLPGILHVNVVAAASCEVAGAAIRLIITAVETQSRIRVGIVRIQWIQGVHTEIELAKAHRYPVNIAPEPLDLDPRFEQVRIVNHAEVFGDCIYIARVVHGKPLI